MLPPFGLVPSTLDSDFTLTAFSLLSAGLPRPGIDGTLLPQSGAALRVTLSRDLPRSLSEAWFSPANAGSDYLRHD